MTSVFSRVPSVIKYPLPCFGRKINAPCLYSNHKGLRLPPGNRAPPRVSRSFLEAPEEMPCMSQPATAAATWSWPLPLCYPALRARHASCCSRIQLSTTFLPSGKPSDPPLPVHAFEWLLFAWLQGWVYDLGLTNQSSPSPTSNDWFKDSQGGPSRGQEVPWHFTGRAGREASILSTGHELLAATLPLRGASLWTTWERAEPRGGGLGHHVGPWDNLITETSLLLTFSVP